MIVFHVSIGNFSEDEKNDLSSVKSPVSKDSHVNREMRCKMPNSWNQSRIEIWQTKFFEYLMFNEQDVKIPIICF